MKHSIIFVRLDVHKDSIDIALADDGRNGEIRFYGTIGGELDSLDKAIRKVRRSGAELRFVYEAGPCGYEIYRHLTTQGFHCDVIAPSMTPIDLCGRPADRLGPPERRRAHRMGEARLAIALRQLRPLAIVVLLRSVDENCARAERIAGWSGARIVVPYPGRWVRWRA